MKLRYLIIVLTAVATLTISACTGTPEQAIETADQIVTRDLNMERYPHNWDENSVAYIPEVTAVDMSALSRDIPSVETLRQYKHNWDENPVAYVPEATLIK